MIGFNLHFRPLHYAFLLQSSQTRLVLPELFHTPWSPRLCQCCFSFILYLVWPVPLHPFSPCLEKIQSIQQDSVKYHLLPKDSPPTPELVSSRALGEAQPASDQSLLITTLKQMLHTIPILLPRKLIGTGYTTCSSI